MGVLLPEVTILRIAWRQEGLEGSDDVVVWVMVKQVGKGLQECTLETGKGGRAQKDRKGSAIVGVRDGGGTKQGVQDLLC